jgi:hypothetical protein
VQTMPCSEQFSQGYRVIHTTHHKRSFHCGTPTGLGTLENKGKHTVVIGTGQEHVYLLSPASLASLARQGAPRLSTAGLHVAQAGI